jgi:hypothetical protein
MSEQQLSRQDYLDTMSNTWDTYLAALNSLPEADQQRYAQQQGFASLKEVLAHINDWWEETLRIVPVWAKGESPTFDYEDYDTFETRSMARHRDQNLAQIEQDFENLRGQVAALIAELPESAFANPQIATLLYRVIIVHYQKHEPDAEAQIPAAKHQGVYKNE